MGKVIPLTVTVSCIDTQPLPEAYKFVPYDVSFPPIPADAIDEFCNRLIGWNFIYPPGGGVQLDAGFALAYIVRYFEPYQDLWLCFIRTLKELVDDYLPENIVGYKFTPQVEAMILSKIKSREMAILNAGGRTFAKELRYRLGLDCIRGITCSLNDLT